MTHCRSSWEKCRSCLIAGRATFTTETSTMTMNCAATVTASTSHFLRSLLLIGGLRLRCRFLGGHEQEAPEGTAPAATRRCSSRAVPSRGSRSSRLREHAREGGRHEVLAADLL